MAKAIINGQAIFGNVHMGEGGGSAPEFTETILADNSAQASSFTLSDSMNNYDFIVFKCTNGSTGTITETITTPTHLSNIFTLTTNRFLLNEPGTNQYVDYTINGNTLTRYANRNLNITEVRGLKCNNKTVTETLIYLAPALSSTAVAITGKTGLLDHDLIFFSGNAGAWDDTSLSLTPFKKDKFEADYYCHFLQYYGAFVPVYITDTELSTARYLCVTAVNFS